MWLRSGSTAVAGEFKTLYASEEKSLRPIPCVKSLRSTRTKATERGPGSQGSQYDSSRLLGHNEFPADVYCLRQLEASNFSMALDARSPLSGASCFMESPLYLKLTVVGFSSRSRSSWPLSSLTLPLCSSTVSLVRPSRSSRPALAIS